MILDAWRNWKRPAHRPHKPDYRLLLPALVLLALGALIQSILGPALVANQVNELSAYYFFWRHVGAIVVGLMALYLGFKINLRYWLKYSPHILIAGIIIGLAAVIFGGGGDVRWLHFQGFSIQPAEILKLGFILVAAGYLWEARNADKTSFWEIIKANYVNIILLGIMGVLILILQRDYGSTFVIVTAFLAMLWVSGIPARFLWILLMAVVLIGTLFIVIEPHRRERLAVYANPMADCQDAGYQICQALIGTGSGGWTGRGFSGSIQIYGYLPEANNDSVFAIYAELAGFLGATAFVGVLLYFLFLMRKIAAALEDPLMLIAVGFMTWIGVQSFVNIAGILNLIPLKGITLPLVSFGGSSLAVILLTLGILLQLSAYTIYGNERRIYQGGSRRRRDRRPRYAAGRSRRRN